MWRPIEAQLCVLQLNQEWIFGFPRLLRHVGVLDETRKVQKPHVRIVSHEMMQGSEIAEINDDLVVVRIGAMKSEGEIATCLQPSLFTIRGMAFRNDTTANKFIKATFGKGIHERLAVDVRGSVLLLGTGEIVVRGLTQVADILSENRILDFNVREIVQPRNGDILEVMVGLQEPQHFDVPLIDLSRNDCPTRADGRVAAAMSAREGFHTDGIKHRSRRD
jgi:hypothetical protein